MKKIKIDWRHLPPFMDIYHAQRMTKLSFLELAYMSRVVFSIKYRYRDVHDKIQEGCVLWGVLKKKHYNPPAEQPKQKSGD